jgi:hypothetical protein
MLPTGFGRVGDSQHDRARPALCGGTRRVDQSRSLRGITPEHQMPKIQSLYLLVYIATLNYIARAINISLSRKAQSRECKYGGKMPRAQLYD